MSRLLLIARNSDLRESIEFALRAEGHEVSCASALPDSLRGGPRPDCTIVDHHAIGDDPEGAVSFFRESAPVILLANRVPHLLSPWAFRTVLKPFLGAPLSDAVRDALQLSTATK